MQAKKIVAGFLLMIFAVTAQAQNEKSRIKHGVKNGELTKNETIKLVKQQKEIKQEVKVAKTDGIVTNAERKDIRQDKRKASRNIYVKKHNKKDRN